MMQGVVSITYCFKRLCAPEVLFSYYRLKKNMPPSCSVCDKEFDDHGTLAQHLQDAGHVQCQSCGATFYSLSACSQHYDDKHR